MSRKEKRQGMCDVGRQIGQVYVPKRSPLIAYKLFLKEEGVLKPICHYWNGIQAFHIGKPHRERPRANGEWRKRNRGYGFSAWKAAELVKGPCQSEGEEQVGREVRMWGHIMISERAYRAEYLLIPKDKA